MATRLIAMTRGVDVVARFGGDEFVALAEVDHEDDAVDMAERIRAGLSQPVTIGDAHLVITASVGIVVTADAMRRPPRSCATRTTPCTRPSATAGTRSSSTATTPATWPT